MENSIQKDKNKAQNLRNLGFNKEVDRAFLGLCPFCGDAVRIEDLRDPLSVKEASISGLCQKCQDEIFSE